MAGSATEDLLYEGSPYRLLKRAQLRTHARTADLSTRFLKRVLQRELPDLVWER